MNVHYSKHTNMTFSPTEGIFIHHQPSARVSTASYTLASNYIQWDSKNSLLSEALSH